MFLTWLKLRVTSLECPHFSKTLCQTLQNVLHTPRVGNMPMLIFPQLLAFRQMLTHSRKRNPFTISAVISHRQCQEVIPNNATDIYIVMQTCQRFIMEKFMFRVSHGLSSIKSLTPNEWVGNRHVTLRLRSLCLPTWYSNYTTLQTKCQGFFTTLSSDTRGRCLHPKPKELGFDTETW